MFLFFTSCWNVLGKCDMMSTTHVQMSQPNTCTYRRNLNMADVNPGEGHMVVPHTILATNQKFKIFKINFGVLISYECYKKLPQT